MGRRQVELLRDAGRQLLIAPKRSGGGRTFNRT